MLEFNIDSSFCFHVNIVNYDDLSTQRMRTKFNTEYLHDFIDRGKQVSIPNKPTKINFECRLKY